MGSKCKLVQFLLVDFGKVLCSSANELQLRDCDYQEWGAEKLELSSKNLDSTPPSKQKKLVLTPLCYVKNNIAKLKAPPPSND